MRMSISRYACLVVFGLLTSLSMQAQFLDYGSDPARFKWNIVKLPHYNLVYPQGNDSISGKCLSAFAEDDRDRDAEEISGYSPSG